MEILQTFAMPSAWLALLTLVFLEIVLGIDNVVFISVTSSSLPAKQQKHARTTGLLLAMLARIGLLFGISILMQLTKPIFSFELSWIAGGLFLLYKSVTEVHKKLEGKGEGRVNKAKGQKFWGIIAQIVILDMVFSFDSILTAIGMVGFKTYGYEGSMAIMIIAIVIAIFIMVGFSGWVSKIINKYPSIQMLALSFLILIAVMLLVESAHLSSLIIFGREIHEIPRGYIYFAISFSLMVEIFNIRMSKRNRSRKKKAS